MPHPTPADLLDDDWDYQTGTGRQRRRDRKKVKTEHTVRDEVVRHQGLETVTAHMGAAEVFNPTFVSSQHEREWILTYLGRFYDDKIITDVLRRVKGGKEANVYCCAAHPDTGLKLVAAKVYRPRALRNLRNDGRYRQGRAILDERGKAVRDERLLHAIQKKTARGKEAEYASWLVHEYQTLLQLYKAGADVPQPVASGDSTILMEYLGEADEPAPALHEVRLDADEAPALFERLLHNVELMLAHGRIHGDLSAYNVLYWAGEVRLIDFPQAVDPEQNPEAFPILERDVIRLCQHFARYGVRANGRAIAAELWQRYGTPPAGPADLLPTGFEDEEAAP